MIVLGALVWIGLTICTRFVAVAQQDQGRQIESKTETHIADTTSAAMYAGAGTIIN
jgi:hypothetical protein